MNKLTASDRETKLKEFLKVDGNWIKIEMQLAKSSSLKTLSRHSLDDKNCLLG